MKKKKGGVAYTVHSAQCNLPHLPILLLKACGVGSNWRRAGNNQLLTKAACGKAAGAISGRSLIRTHCIPPFSFPLYPAVFHTLTLIIPHCIYTFYIFFYTLILFHTTQAFIRTNSFLLYSIVYPPFLSMCSPCPKMPFV